MTELQSFELGNIDLNVPEEALKSSGNSSGISYLTQEMTGRFKVISFTPSKLVKTDAKGNRWASGCLLVSTNINGFDRRVRDFIDVPLDNPGFVSKDGRVSYGKFNRLKGLVESLGLEMSQDTLSNLPSLAPNKELIARSYYAGDRVVFHDENLDGTATYAIQKRDGGKMLDDDGNIAVFNDRDAALAYYKQVTGKYAVSGLKLTGFSPAGTVSIGASA